MTIFLDMDGVAVNFIKDACGLINLPDMNLIAPAELPKVSLERWLIEATPETDVKGVLTSRLLERIRSYPMFWQNLQPYPWFDALIEGLGDHGEIIMVSTPAHDASSATGKLEWLHHHLGANFTSYMFGWHRELLAAPDRILIDDDPSYIKAWADSGGKAILFPQLWNTPMSKIPSDRVKYILEILEKITDSTAELVVGDPDI